MEIEKMYEQLGVSRTVYEYGEAVLESLRPRFDEIDQTAEYNQGKVLAAMQRNKVNDTHFAATWLLDPRAPKVEMPPELKDRVARMSAEAKKIEEAE